MLTYSKLGQYGRLGNQLWQIASTIGIANKNNSGYIFPDWSYTRFFKHQLPQGPLLGTKVYNEHTTSFSDVVLDNKYNWDLVGYFQSWKYFVDYQDEIKYYFDFSMDRSNLNAVSIHVRRTDYLTNQHVHPVLGLDYYKKALKYFDKSTMLYVFSDDINWCTRYFKGGIFKGRNIIFDVASGDITSLITMSQCSHHIIANSSFSWWGAYLGVNAEKIVIAPSKWTKLPDDKIEDRVLPNWILI
jgi:hypothetical protein